MNFWKHLIHDKKYYYISIPVKLQLNLYRLRCISYKHVSPILFLINSAERLEQGNSFIL